MSPLQIISIIVIIYLLYKCRKYEAMKKTFIRILKEKDSLIDKLEKKIAKLSS